METAAIFLDAGAVIARYRADDANHRLAVEGWSRIGKGERFCMTTPFVIAEAATMLARIHHYKFAAERARLLLTSPLIRIVRTTVDEEIEAAAVMEKYADQRIGFVDCVSLVVGQFEGRTARHGRDARVTGGVLVTRASRPCLETQIDPPPSGS